MNQSLKRLYDRLPVAAQSLLFSAYSCHLHKQRYMGDYPRYRAKFIELEGAGPDAIRDYQEERLAAVVRHAWETVPYYRRTFQEHGLRPEDVTRLEDLHKVPLLTKDDFKTHFRDLVSTAYDPRKLHLGHTSGTTGSPLEIYYDPGVMYATYAALDRQYRWAGVRLQRRGDRIAVMRGNVIVPLEQSSPPYWRHNWFHNHLLLSSFHLSPDTLDSYVEAIRRFNPAALDGYPSNLYILARHLLNSGETLPLPAVLTSSETLFDIQREAIEAAFRCRIFDYYGLAERTVFAAECDRHEGHHLCQDYGLTEILDDSANAVAPGGAGRIVSTSLHNSAMPMIRYVTSDTTALKPEPCSCGCQFPLMEDVCTKAEDTLTLADGRLISPSALTHPFKPLHTIDESQIVQTAPDRVLVKIVAGSSFTEAQKSQLVRDLESRIGAGVRIEVALVDSIPRTASGKFRWVISEVPPSI